MADAPSPHGLNSSHHTGTLDNSQFPQGLLTDGSRTLTGNLAVSSGVTVDGVDISVLYNNYQTHLGNPLAHNYIRNLLDDSDVAAPKGVTTNDVKIYGDGTDITVTKTASGLLISYIGSGGGGGGGSFSGIKDPAGTGVAPDGLGWILTTDDNVVNLTASGANTLAFSIVQGNITHNNLGGLTTGDPHTQYPLLTGTETISGLWTFSRSTNPPFAVNSGAGKVANLDADKVDGYHLDQDVRTTGMPQFTAINLGHASDTTIARVSAGLISVEGVTVTLNTATQTLTNKTLTTPTIASFVNAQHNHSNAAGGGTIAHSVLIGIGANDHHNQSHVLASTSGLGADHTVSGLTARQVLRATSATTAAFGAIEDADIPSTIVRTSRTLTAGAGLTGGGDLTANRTFNVGAGAGLTVNADDVALTTPGSVTVSSANSSSGNHTHAVASSSNPGSAASLLATDASGRLNLAVLGVGGLPSGSDKFNVTGHATLDSADFDGAVTIDDDLTVVYGGYSPLHVYVNTSTPQNSNVGIMPQNLPGGVADSQFALDVGGPIRGEVLVGPHAIQLEDAEMIVHFDGPRPYETDFSGFSTGHMGQVGTESGGVIYRPGKFGKAVQVAEATTNLFTNPSFETGVTSWNVTGTATFVQSSDWFYYGSYSGRFQSTNVQRIETDVTANTSAGTQYTYTCFVRGSGTVYLRFFDNVSGNQAGSNIALSDDWQRVVLTKTFGAGSTSRYVHIVSTGAIDCYVDAVQLEQKSYATPYCDGSLGSGHSWSGTAHASTSSRTQAKAYWDIEYHAPFTAMGWFSYADALRAEASGGDRVHFGLYSGSNYIWVYLNDGDQPFAVTNVETRTINNTTDGLTWAAGTWHHWAFTLDASGNATLYIDGVEDGNATTFATMSGWTFDRLYLSTALASGHVYNGLTDDVALVGKVLSANEIRAIYESNAPVFAESSVFSFRAPTRSPVWVDEEGLWMRSYSGNDTFGIYAADATKSWGGLTLYDSDLAIGNSTAGYVHWHSGVDSDDTTYYGSPALQIAARLHVKGNSTIDGSLTIGTGGYIASGATGYNSGTGLWLEYNGGTPRLFVGNAAGNKMTWDGSALTLVGGITATTGAIGGWTIGATTLTGGNATLSSAGKLTLGTSNDVAIVDASDATYRLWVGHATAGSAPFRVTKAGALTASNANITGAITANSGSIAGALTIGGSGGIYQGTGSFGSPTTGLKIWNDGGIGRIAGYNSEIVQWYGATDGKLYAGGGNVVLDTNGVDIIGSRVRLFHTAGSQIGKLYSQNPLDSALLGSAGIGIQSQGTASIESVQIHAKSSSGRSVEIFGEAATSTSTNRAVMHVTAGVSSAASTLTLSQTVFSVYVGNNETSGLTMNSAGLLTVDSLSVLGAAYLTDIRPVSDSTTAVQVKQAGGTAFVTFDSTNKRVGINRTPTGYDFEVTGNVYFDSSLDVNGNILPTGYVARTRTLNQSIAAGGNWDTGITVGADQFWIVRIMTAQTASGNIVDAAVWLIARQNTSYTVQRFGGTSGEHSVSLSSYAIRVTNTSAGTRYHSFSCARFL